MKNQYDRLVQNDQEFLRVYAHFLEDEKFNYTVAEVKKWFKERNTTHESFPKEYPCLVSITHHTYEVDDVGMGFCTETKIQFTYKHELERNIDELNKKLNLLTP